MKNIILWSFCIVLFLVVMIPATNATISDITADFDLFPEAKLGGHSVLHFSSELTTQQPLELLKVAGGKPPVSVKSAIIRKAEGGMVIGLYHRSSDTEPAVSISFVIDIHDEVSLDSLDHPYSKDNVNVFVRDPAHGNLKFEKVDISKPEPHFFVL
jgi:hypothetical protein